MDRFGRTIGTLYFIMIFILVHHKVQSFCCKELPSFISEHLDDYWYKYKAQFNKTYSSNNDKIRRLIWEQNLRHIYNHNLLATAGHFSFTLRDNVLADMSKHHYLKYLTTLITSKHNPVTDNKYVGAIHHDPNKIPSSLDWREKGFITPTEEQIMCGSCYAYSIARSIQGQFFKKHNMNINLSVQQLVDCSTQMGNVGCTGGSLRNTLRYLETVGGITDEQSYPYIDAEQQCKYHLFKPVVNITSGGILPEKDERMLQAAVATLGPIAASINASPDTFKFYYSGIYDDPECTDQIINHAVLIVGYTPKYWIVKNWWGYDWGEGSYMRIAKMKNMCGIANFAAYAKIGGI